jgi:hypothetical protein
MADSCSSSSGVLELEEADGYNTLTWLALFLGLVFRYF